MKKQISYSSDARKRLKSGVEKLNLAVQSTLGPRGKTVLIETPQGTTLITKDGVTVAKHVELTDPIENLGANICKEVSAKTATLAGDGTTTATVLANSLISNGLDLLERKSDILGIREGLEEALQDVNEFIQSAASVISIEGDELEKIATISANNDASIGKMIADAVRIVKTDGVITVEESRGIETYMEQVDGLQFDRGYLSPYFVTDQNRLVCEYDSPLILITGKRISSIQEIVPILEKAVQANKPLLIIADDIEAQALGLLVVNRVKGNLKVAAVKAPGFGDRRKEILEDIAVLTDGIVISDELGLKLEDVEIEHLGSCEKITVDKGFTTIINGDGYPDVIESRIESLKAQIEREESDYSREKLQERLAKLTGGVAVLHVGATTETEMREKKDRVDDAVHATRAALERGIVPGGGLAFLLAAQRLQSKLNDLGANPKAIGYRLMIEALHAPIRQILVNSGLNDRDINATIYHIIDSNANKTSGFIGYNAVTNQFETLIETGVIDPAKVTQIALENAVSIATMILSTETVIANEPESDSNMQNSMNFM